MNERRFAWVGVGGLAATLGACQLVSGLSGYTPTSSAAGTGGAASSSTGTGSATTSSAGTGGIMAGSTGAGVLATSASAGGTMASSTSDAASTSSGLGGCTVPGDIKCGSAGCIDPTASPANCGGCNLACADPLATCKASVCQPVDLGGQGYEAVTAISANAQGVSWATMTTHTVTVTGGATLYLRPASGSTASQLIDYPGVVGGLVTAADGMSVFFTQLDTMTLKGGLSQWVVLPASIAGVNPLVAASQLGAVGPVTNAPHRVLWEVKQGNTWNVFAVDLLNLAMPNAYPMTVTSSVPLTTDGASMYWPLVNTFEGLKGVDGTTFQVTSLTTSPTYLAADTLSPTGFIYWLTGASAYRTRTDSTSSIGPASMATNLTNPKGLAVSGDGSAVYWLEGGPTCASASGAISKATWAAASAPLLSGLSCPDNLTLDGTYLYYSAGPVGNVHVYRVPM